MYFPSTSILVPPYLRKYDASNPRHLNNWVRKWIKLFTIPMQAILRRKLESLAYTHRTVLPNMRLLHCVSRKLEKMLYFIQHVVNLLPDIKNARRCDVVFTLPRNQQNLTHIRVLLRYARKDNYRPNILITRSYVPSSQSVDFLCEFC